MGRRIIACLLLLLGCSSNAPPAAGDGGSDVSAPPPDAGADVLMPPPIMRTMNEAALAPQRAACTFAAGAWPAQTLGVEDPVGSDIPIDHVIVFMQENRSFDHYLGQLVAQGYYQPTELDGPPAGWAMPDGDGGTVSPHPDTEHCYGLNHGWNDMHADWDNGQNDGFVINNNPDGERTLFYEDDTVIPFYYALANDFAVGDRYFCSVLTSTWPNRLFMMAGTSFGIGDNSFVTVDTSASPAPQVFSMLEAAGRTWRDYTDGPHQESFFPAFGFSKSTLSAYRNMKCDMLTDIQNGTLPDVAFAMGDEVGTETSDEGPSALPGIGGAMVEALIRALFASPLWSRTALFFMYDENGGTADHVPPPKACPPDSYSPHDGNNDPLPGAFDHTGFRVPFLVVSPYAKKHYVSHVVYDHTSVLRFIEARFGLPALTARDANATPPYDMFDFASPPQMTPPNITATTTVSQAILTQCSQSLVKMGCP